MALHLVTGGAGFIGSSIAEALLSSGERVRVLDDFSSGRRDNVEGLSGEVELIEGSILDPEVVSRAMRGVEVVFHEAAIPSVVRSIETPRPSMQVGVQGTTVVLDAARRAGVRRVVFAASSSVYGDATVLPQVEVMPLRPPSPYAVSKLAGEHLMRVFAALYGLETVSLRYFNVFGPRENHRSEYAAVIPKFIVAALRGGRVHIFGDGEHTRDFCYIDNVVQANLLAATTGRKLMGEAVDVACGVSTSLNALLAAIGEIVGARVETIHGPARHGDVRDSCADIRAAIELLGYEPTVDLGAGLRRTIEAFRRSMP